MTSNRRNVLTAASLAALALTGVGCSSTNRASKPMPCNPSAMRYSPGVGDSLGAGSFHQPMVVAYYEAMQATPGEAFATVPTE